MAQSTGRENAVANLARKGAQAERRQAAMKSDRIVAHKDKRRV